MDKDKVPLGKKRPVGGIGSRIGLIGLSAAVLAVVAYSSCGDSDEFNLYEPVAKPLALKGDRAAMEEEARVLMDNGDYEGAVNILDDMVGDADLDLNTVRLLYAAAQLGVAELDIWSIIKKVLESRFESTSSSSSGSSGITEFFDQLTDTFLGTGSTRTKKLVALSNAITTLNSAPEPNASQVRNTACLLAGMLAVPTLADAESALTETVTALNTIKDSATSGGSECPDLSLLDTATASVTTAATYFAQALAAATNCPFLDLSETEALMNTVESQLNTMIDNADKGCAELPECPAGLSDCAELFPTCVQESLEIGSENAAVAGDGNIAQCELILHCTDPTVCFSTN